MKSFIASLILAIICLASSASAFSVRPASVVSTAPVSASLSPTSLNVFGKRKTKAQLEEEAEIAAQYWGGEWVCKDCGYIYNRVSCWILNEIESRKGVDRIDFKITLNHSSMHLSLSLFLFLLDIDCCSKNVLACSLKNKELVSVVLSALDPVVVMPRRSETVLELH